MPDGAGIVKKLIPPYSLIPGLSSACGWIFNLSCRLSAPVPPWCWAWGCSTGGSLVADIGGLSAGGFLG